LIAELDLMAELDSDLELSWQAVPEANAGQGRELSWQAVPETKAGQGRDLRDPIIQVKILQHPQHHRPIHSTIFPLGA
jgi:hypothetical protein